MQTSTATSAIRSSGCRHIQDSVNLYSGMKNLTLPAVSIVKPNGYIDGHRAFLVQADSGGDLDRIFEGKLVKDLDGRVV
jgi:hypothetical protein